MQRHDLPLANGRLAYWLRAGRSKRWAILLHGGGVDHSSFQGQLELFDEDWNLLLPDMRGGGSTVLDAGVKPDFNDIVEDIARLAGLHGIRGAVIIGHSFGAAVAQEVAYRYPAVVGKLVLMGGYNHHREFTTGWMDATRVALTNAVLALIPWPVLASLFARMCTADKTLRRRVRAALLDTGARNWQALGMSAFRSMHKVEQYAQPHPTLLLRGERDNPRFHDRIYSEMQRVNPDTQIVVIPGTGHLAPQEEPAQTNRVIARFLNLPVVPPATLAPQQACEQPGVEA